MELGLSKVGRTLGPTMTHTPDPNGLANNGKIGLAKMGLAKGLFRLNSHAAQEIAQSTITRFEEALEADQRVGRTVCPGVWSFQQVVNTVQAERDALAHEATEDIQLQPRNQRGRAANHQPCRRRSINDSIID